MRPCNEGLSKSWTNFAWAFANISTRYFSSENKWINFKTRTLDNEITYFEVGLDGIEMSTELTTTLTSNLPQALVLTSQNASTVSFLVVKPRKRDSQFMWERINCFSFPSNFRQLSQPKPSCFECGAEQRYDLNNNFWLDCLTARAYVLRKNKGCLPHILQGIWDFVRLINISNKFFEKILDEWTICEAEKAVIKFAEKGKRKKNWQSRKTLLPQTKNVCFTHKYCKAWFLFYRIMPFKSQMQLNDKLYPGFF